MTMPIQQGARPKMVEIDRHTAAKISSERSFGLVFVAFFAIVAIYPLFFGGDLRVWAAVLAAGFAAVAVARPQLLRPLNVAWFKLGLLIGRFMSPVVLSLMFFCVIAPIGLLMRVFGHDPLRLKRKGSADSYWILRDEAENPMQSMRNQF